MSRLPIHSLDDPRLDVYRHLKQTNHTRWSGLFIAEGKRVVERLIASRFPVDSLLVSDRMERQIADRVPAPLPMYVLEQSLAQQVVGYNFHAGILGCGRRQPVLRLREVFDAARPRQTWVVCPNTNDPDNLGSMIRLASGFGVEGMLLGRGCADPFSRRVLRISMGNALHLPIVESDDLAGDLRFLADECGFQCVATVLDESATPLERAKRALRVCLLFGNESHGLEREWVELCPQRVTIPMHPETDSLNVAHAAAIVMYHFERVAGC